MTIVGERQRRDRVRRRAAVAIAVMGLIDLVSGVTPPLGDRVADLRGWVPFTVPEASAMLVTAAGLALVLLAGGLRRGHRRAWATSLALLVLSAALHVVKGLDVEEAVAALAMAGYLAARRECFPVASSPRQTRAGLLTALLGASIATLAAGLALHLTHPGGLHLPLGEALVAAAERLVGLTSIAVPGRTGHLLTRSLEGVGLGLLATAAWLALRPLVTRHAPATHVDPRVREIVARHGAGTLDYFALRDDKVHFLWGDSVVAYSVRGGVCLVSPDPIGPVEERAEVWAAFRRFAEEHGWTVAILGVSEGWLPTYEADDMRSLYVGDEAIVDLPTFSLDGKRGKGLRHAVNRAETAGYTFELRDPSQLGPELAAELRRVLTESRRGGVERGYAMTLGRAFDPEDHGLLLGIAYEPSGEVAAFCQFVPAPGIGGWSLDLMRRSDRDHPNSITDFVVVSTILAIREWGATGLALNFATLRAVLAGEAGDGWSTRVQALVARQLSESMQIESLWRYNSKYRPRWQPRFAVYDQPEHVVPSALAVARAESFWELPVIGRFLRPSEPAPVPAPERERELVG